MNNTTKITIGTVIVAGVLLIVFRKQLRSLGKNLRQKRENWDINQELRDEDKEGGEQTFPDSWYADQANALQALFEGCGVYVDENIVNIMKKLKNNTDYLLLKKKFGVRKFDGCNWEFNFGWDEGNLVQSLNGELSYDEIKEINDHFSSVGITYNI